MDTIQDFVRLDLCNQVYISLLIILISLFQGLGLSRKNLWIKLCFCLSSQTLVVFYLVYHGVYSMSVHLFYFIFTIPLTLLLWVLFSKVTDENFRVDIKLVQGEIWKLILPIQKGKYLIYDNIKRGISIMGSSGSGKSESAPAEEVQLESIVEKVTTKAPAPVIEKLDKREAISEVTPQVQVEPVNENTSETCSDESIKTHAESVDSAKEGEVKDVA